MNTKFSDFINQATSDTSFLAGYDGNSNTRYSIADLKSGINLSSYVRALHRNTAAQTINAASATEFTNAQHTIDISALRVGSLIICQGFVTGTGVGFKGLQMSSNASTPSIPTVTANFCPFVLYARYTGGVNGTLRFFRGGAYGIAGTTTYSDVNAVNGQHVLKLIGVGQTLTLEHCSYTLIY